MEKDFLNTAASSFVQCVAEGMKDITFLLYNEDIIKKACMAFKTLLTVMSTFGGGLVIEYAQVGF